MRADIDENGKLSVIPETQVETFALRVWWEDYMNNQRSQNDGRQPFATLHVQLIERA